MRLASAQQALLIDEVAHQEFKIPNKKLIEEAGSKMAEAILKIRERPTGKLQKGVTVVCGPGHNGDDGRAVALRLAESGISTMVVTPEQLATAGAINGEISNGEILVDAIFGVGLTRNVEGVFAKAIAKINAFAASGGIIVSLDVPSGLNATSGRVMGVAVKANYCLMVAPLRTGAFLRDGPQHCGDIVPIHVSFPPEVVERIAREYFLLPAPLANSWIPHRDAKFNKSKFGHAYIVAGSKGKWGAAVLAARSAFRAGAGYVVHSSFDEGNILSEVPEAMSVEFKSLLADVSGKKNAAIAIGPGSGFAPELLKFAKRLMAKNCSVVLDADALTLLAQNPFQLRPDWIITPHSGELSRLLSVPVEEIENNPLAAAKSAYKKFGCTVVLKGFHTIVTSGYSGRSVIVKQGNVALAKAGTGDVLTGLITGFLAQGLHPVQAALLGVYIHGASADDWVRENSNASLSASDLVDRIPKTMKLLENSGK
jgi:ADP-dependent NAD(P)H-hydrate dehydratase / NAD(P)H-hydrate epimerase